MRHFLFRVLFFFFLLAVSMSNINELINSRGSCKWFFYSVFLRILPFRIRYNVSWAAIKQSLKRLETLFLVIDSVILNFALGNLHLNYVFLSHEKLLERQQCHNKCFSAPPLKHWHTCFLSKLLSSVRLSLFTLLSVVFVFMCNRYAYVFRISVQIKFSTYVPFSLCFSFVHTNRQTERESILYTAS